MRRTTTTRKRTTTTTTRKRGMTTTTTTRKKKRGMGTGKRSRISWMRMTWWWTCLECVVLDCSFSYSHFIFKRPHVLRNARKLSQRAAAMQEAAAGKAAGQTPGPSNRRKRKLSSPQVRVGSKRNRGLQRQSQATAEDISDYNPIEGLAEALVSLGYPPDFGITVRFYL